MQKVLELIQLLKKSERRYSFFSVANKVARKPF